MVDRVIATAGKEYGGTERMIVLQLIVYCLLFTVMVRYAVRGGAIDGLYFYPKAVQDRAIEIGLTDRE